MEILIIVLCVAIISIILTGLELMHIPPDDYYETNYGCWKREENKK